MGFEFWGWLIMMYDIFFCCEKKSTEKFINVIIKKIVIDLFYQINRRISSVFYLGR